MNYNKVMIGGYLTRDIEIRKTGSGTVVAKFGIATTRKYGGNESTCFLDCTAFGRVAETLSQYLSKGSPLFLEGRIEHYRWETDDGEKRSKHSIVVEGFQFLSDGKDRKGSSLQSSRPARSSQEPSRSLYDDDIPF